jgi:hypothetical protein
VIPVMSAVFMAGASKQLLVVVVRVGDLLLYGQESARASADSLAQAGG